MRAIIQRVSHAEVEVDQKSVGKIGKGLLILVGFEEADTTIDLKWMCSKIIQLRIFADKNNLMNLSLQEISGEILLVSQFTLFASIKKGNRPSFTRSAKAGFAEKMYEQMKDEFSFQMGKAVQTGKFGADMKLNILNDGPVTIFMDSKNME